MIPCAADYIYCTDKAVLDAWLLANYPNPDDGSLYEVPVDTAEWLGDYCTYPIQDAGVDEYGNPIHEKNPARDDLVKMIVIHDESFATALTGVTGVTVHRDLCVDDVKVLYPDHAAHANCFACLTKPL